MAQSWAILLAGEAYCASRGYQTVETYVEPGASATTDRRPEFQRMIEAGTSKPAPFYGVIVHSFSRFFRDPTSAAMLEASAHQAITPQMVQRFARTARDRIRIDGGGYRRDHLRALAQRVEVADREVRIIGSKSNLRRTLAAAAGAKPATGGVRSSVLDWRRGGDSNPRYDCPYAAFRVRCIQPLCHLSISLKDKD